jgi:hypothetical protein
MRIVRNPEGEDLLGDIGIRGRMILKWTLRGIRCEEEDWNYLPQHRDQ